MSLDVTLVVTQPTQVFTQNITHNLGLMAAQVELGTTTLYNLLWRPETQGIRYAHELIHPLVAALKELRAKPHYYSQWNPTNGWGTYEALCGFVREYLQACRDNPEAEVHACR